MSRLPHPPRSQLVGVGSLMTSVAVHLVLVGAGALVVSASASRSPVAPTSAGNELAVDLGGAPGRALVEAPSLVERTPLQVVVEPGGGEGLARPDTGRAGRGGSRYVDSAALNLAEHDEGLTLSREVISRIDRDQLQRMNTARARASKEDRRSLEDPMDLVFYATGTGHLEEARPRASTDPNRGALRAPELRAFGSSAGDKRLDDVDATGPAERHDTNGPRTSPGVGVTRGHVGIDHRAAAAVAEGRPRVPKAAEAFAADDKGAAEDLVDSEQEVAAVVQSLVHASTAGGLLGAGEGGEDGTDGAGSAGIAGPGSRSQPFGGGPGPFAAPRDDDPRALAYQRSVLAKISPLWEHAFPQWASLDGQQGKAIVSLVIYSTGQIDEVRVTRPSGVPEFDENVRKAVLAAAPFAPFPPAIPRLSMRWSLTFDMVNPVVR